MVSKVTWRLQCVVAVADCVNIFKEGDFPALPTQDELMGVVAGDVVLPPSLLGDEPECVQVLAGSKGVVVRFVLPEDDGLPVCEDVVAPQVLVDIHNVPPAVVVAEHPLEVSSFCPRMRI